MHTYTKFGAFMLKFNELGVHFSRLSSFSLSEILIIAVGFRTLTE